MEIKISPEALLEFADSDIDEPNDWLIPAAEYERIVRHRRERILAQLAAGEKVEISWDMKWATKEELADLRRLVREHNAAQRAARGKKRTAAPPTEAAASK